MIVAPAKNDTMIANCAAKGKKTRGIVTRSTTMTIPNYLIPLRITSTP